MKKLKNAMHSMTYIHVLLLIMACSNVETDVPNPQNKINNTPHSVVKVDTTNPKMKREVLHDMWQVANRISPKNGVSVRPGMKVNVVRMVGGINKKVNGVRVPDLDYDLAFYNPKTGSYTYNFAPLTQRIDAIIKGGTPIYQLVLDQPPWAFQRGYHFIADDQKDGIHFREHERVSIYGNSLPPYDLEAYSDFIKALMTHLVKQYGQPTVESWRLRVGSEIETPDHWYGTEQEFIAYFAATVKAIRHVLPNAKVGLHTRAPDFIYREGTITNYKNEVIRSFANAIIEYCYDNNIKYDFWGVSDYPILTIEKTRHPKQKFDELFTGLVTHPKWQKDAVIDVEEFSVVSFIAGAQLISSQTAQADTFMVAMTDHFYTKGVDQVFQWGQREPSHELWRTEALKNMSGKVRYQAFVQSVNKTQNNNSNTHHQDIGAIIAKNASTDDIDALLYHYNPADIEATYSHAITLNINTNVPIQTPFFYRHRQSGIEHKKFQSFMAQSNALAWLKEGKGINKYGDPNKVLNQSGLSAWKSYKNPNPSQWSSWKQAYTQASYSDVLSENTYHSIINIGTELPLFSFEKFEIRWQKPTSYKDSSLKDNALKITK